MKKAVFICILAVMLLITGCAGGGTPVNTEAPSTEQTEVVDSGIEKDILAGKALRVDLQTLIGDGYIIDVDGDGKKETIAAVGSEGFETTGLRIVTVNGEPSGVWFTDDSELWFFSTFGNSVEIAQKTDDPAHAWYLYNSGASNKKPESVPAYEVRSLSAAVTPWDQCGDRLLLYADSIESIERCATIEEYIAKGATADVCSPLLGNMNEKYEIAAKLDLDGDGTREQLLLKGARIVTSNTDELSLNDPPFEKAYRFFEPEGQAIMDEYISMGYNTYNDETIRLYVNGNEFARDDGGGLVYGQRAYFAADPEGGIMLVFGNGGWLHVGWKNGSFNYGTVDTTED